MYGVRLYCTGLYLQYCTLQECRTYHEAAQIQLQSDVVASQQEFHTLTNPLHRRMVIWKVAACGVLAHSV